MKNMTLKLSEEEVFCWWAKFWKMLASLELLPPHLWTSLDTSLRRTRMEETDLSLLHPQPSSASWQALKYFAGSFFSVILLGTAATVLLPVFWFFVDFLFYSPSWLLSQRTELNEDQTVFNLLTAPQWKTTSIFGGYDLINKLMFSQNVPRSRLTLKPLEARVAGVDIPNNKKIEYSLQSIYGVGPVIAKRVLQNSGVADENFQAGPFMQKGSFLSLPRTKYHATTP